MKSLKKTLVLLVVFSMILSAVMPAFAATDVAGLDCEEEVARLEALDVVSGYEDGTYGPEKTITRAEMAVILCKMVGIDTVTVDENKNVPSKFSDVAAGDWYTGYINVAAGKGLLSGFPDGTFRPNDQLTMNQVLTLAVNALGRGEYVAEMGTWPANYIAEATKLGLLDGVKTSEANRGNVAIICWNTLTAPHVWDVTGTEYSDGSINLSNSGASLLSIYFRDYVNANGQLKEIEEVAVIAADLVVDNHIFVAKTELDTFDAVIGVAAVDGIDTFNFNKSTVKDKKVKTYLDATTPTGVYVYVPEEVCEDLDELEDKNVTIMLGEDNVAIAIFVEDEIEAKDFLTAYDATKQEIVVGGTKYDLAKNETAGFGYTVTLNGNSYDGNFGADPKVTPIEDALDVFGIDTEAEFKAIEKKIEATLTLNEEDDVDTIELFASYDIEDVSGEALITKVKETSSKYTIYTTKGKEITWNLEDEEDEEIDFPKVYIDGTKASIRDLTAGMVITLVGTEEADLVANIVLDGDEDALKIYASTNNVVEGDATRVKNSNNAITVDGTVYTRSNAGATQSTKELAKYLDADVTVVPANVLDSDSIALYLNIHGEYAYVILEDAVSDYTFGVVTYVSPSITYEGEDDEIIVRNFKLLLEDGTKKTFKLKSDSFAKEYDFAWIEGAPYSKLEAGDFVAVEANADRVIMIEDGSEVGIVNPDTGAVLDLDDSPVTIGSYQFVSDITDPDKDEEEFKKTTNVYEYDSNDTVIFNAKATKEEVVTKWKAIIKNSTQFEGTHPLAVFENAEATVAKYILVHIDTYGAEDATYAIVENSAYLEDDEKYVDFIEDAGVKIGTDAALTNLTEVNGWFVEYVMSANKVSAAQKLIDVANFANAIDTDLIATYVPAREYVAEIEITTDPNTSLSAEAVTKATFVEEMVYAGTYVFTYDGSKWDITDGAENQDLATYGITVTGAPDAGDVLTVVLTTDANTEIAWNTAPTAVEDIELNEVKISNSGKITLVYEKTGDPETAIGNVKLDKDLIKVYDLRNGKVEETTIQAIKAEVEDGESVYAIPARNGNFENDGENLLFIVK